MMKSGSQRVKIISTNIRLETTFPQKEEIFQVVIDIIKNSTCFKAFTISADIPKIFMQQFWTIIDICPRVEGVDFTDVPNDDTALIFLIDLGYKGPLNRHTNMFEYRLAILDVMLNDTIRGSELYQMFIKYSTQQIPPKKSRGKGSQGKKTTDTPVEEVDVSEESELEPEPAKKNIASKRRVKKKVTISAKDNIIPDLDVALELGKSISLIKAEEVEAARKVHATHARIMTEFIPVSAKKKSGDKSSQGVTIQDTPSALKSKPASLKSKLKGIQSLTPAQQEAANIMQALKESKKSSKIQPGTGGLNKGTSIILGVLDESTVISATSSEGTGTKPGVPDEDKDINEEKDEKDGDADDEGDDHVSDTQDADNEDDNTESDEDEIYKYKIRVRKDEDEEMEDAKAEESDKGDEEITDATKKDAKMTSNVKDDTKKTELPPSSSSLSVSSGFGDQFLKLSFDSSLVRTVKEFADADISSLMDIPIHQETPQTQSLSNINLSAEALAALKTQVPSVVDNYLGSKVGDAKKEQTKRQETPKYVIKSTDKAALEEYVLKSTLYQSMHANKSFNINPANHQLYHALMEAVIEDENVMDKGVADTIKDYKRKNDDDDEGPSAEPNQGKQTKRRRTKESESSKNSSSTKETPKGKAPTKGSKTRSGYHQKDRKPSQNDKTEHGMEKTVQNQGQSPKMPKSESILKNQQSNRSRN
ncbi:hypothetical protein Tco_0440014 [Tanacetum coccineum]